MSQILLTTTETVTIDDLGDVTFTHPTTDFDLLTEWSKTQVLESSDLQTAVSDGKISMKDENGYVVEAGQDLLNFRVNTIISNNIIYIKNAPGKVSTDTVNYTTHTTLTNVPGGCTYKFFLNFNYVITVADTHCYIEVKDDVGTNMLGLTYIALGGTPNSIYYRTMMDIVTLPAGNRTITLDFKTQKGTVYLGGVSMGVEKLL